MTKISGRLTKTIGQIVLGWWTLWALTSGGWEGVWSGEREDCLRALKITSELTALFTCAPAGVLLRPLRLRGVESQPATLTPYAEFDVAPEFR